MALAIASIAALFELTVEPSTTCLVVIGSPRWKQSSGRVDDDETLVVVGGVVDLTGLSGHQPACSPGVLPRGRHGELAVVAPCLARQDALAVEEVHVVVLGVLVRTTRPDAL